MLWLVFLLWIYIMSKKVFFVVSIVFVFLGGCGYEEYVVYYEKF